MDARVNEEVQLALNQQRATESQDVMISPAYQRHSSCASTAVPNVAAECWVCALKPITCGPDMIRVGLEP